MAEYEECSNGVRGRTYEHESSEFVKKGEDMRTEKEIRERKDEIEKLLETHLNLGIVDSHVSAFHVVLEWVLQDSELS